MVTPELEFNAETGGAFTPAEYVPRLSQGIWDIALTRRGTRPGQPNYGMPGGFTAADVTAPDAVDSIPASVEIALSGIAEVTSASIQNAILVIAATVPDAPLRLNLHAALRGPNGGLQPSTGQQIFQVSPVEELQCPAQWVIDPPSPNIERMELRYNTSNGTSEARIVTSLPNLFDNTEADYLDAWDNWYLQWSNGVFSDAILLERPGTPTEGEVSGEYIYSWALPNERLADLSAADANRSDPWTVYLYRYA